MGPNHVVLLCFFVLKIVSTELSYPLKCFPLYYTIQRNLKSYTRHPTYVDPVEE